MRILIIDDYQDTADVLAMLLSNLGHQTMVAYTGHAGIQATETFSPDLVILDIGLPDISGYDVASRIRVIRNDIFILAATGQKMLDVAAAGFDRYELKPFGMETLQNLIRTRE